MNTRDSIISYLEFMLKSPIATWWAVATGLIGVISFLVLSSTAQISRIWLTVIIFGSSLCLFTGVSALLKAWPLWRKSSAAAVRQIVRAEKEHVFLLEGLSDSRIGLMLEIYRTRESVEVPIGLIEITHQRDDGLVQAKAVWIMPVHMREIETRELSPQSLCAYAALSRDTLERWIEQKAEMKIHDLMKRGKS
jgi:hypothetical protein